MLKAALSERSLDLSAEHFSPLVMGCTANVGEIGLRQYLLTRIGYTNLNNALLFALCKKGGRVVFPLPKQWRTIIAEHGFAVAHVRSALLWQCYVFGLLLYGMGMVVKVACSAVVAKKCAETQPTDYAYFAALGPGNLPRKIGDHQSHDIVSWYLQWPGRRPEVEEVRHSVAGSIDTCAGNIPVVYQSGPLPALCGWRNTLGYIFWGVGASVIAFLDMLRGRWWHALLLNQAALAAQVRRLPTHCLASEYLFHNSGWAYRPLWTYEAESRGSAITLYFYSTNCEPFKKPDGYPPMFFGYKAMSWPRYLVWDEYQADFVRRAVGQSASVQVVGPIWFHSNADVMPKLEQSGVAVFDVTPHRFSRYCTLGLDSEFYTPVVTNPFLRDVSRAVTTKGLLMLWKRKRNIGRIAHPHYRYLADRLAETPMVKLVAPEISAIRVIESSMAVISMPFTSTALIARELGKPSIYYDPSGIVQHDDRAAHGIPVISGPEKLEQWLSTLSRGQ